MTNIFTLVAGKSVRAFLFLSIVFLLNSSAHGQVTVNPGGTPYATVNDAFAAINAGTHTGAITIEISGNTSEPAAPVVLEASGVGSSSYSSITIFPIVSGVVIGGASNASTGILVFNGADNITINGNLNNGTGTSRDLIIQNSIVNTSSHAVLWFRSTTSGTQLGSTNITIKNTNITGNGNPAGTSATSPYSVGVVFAATSTTFPASTTLGANHSNISIQNNHIQRVGTGIQMGNATASPIANVIIEGNEIGSVNPADYVYHRGMWLSNTTSALIKQNHIFNIIVGTSQTVTRIGIEMAGTGSSSAVVERNHIHSLANFHTGGYAGYGLVFSGGSNHTAVNNIIYDISGTSWNTQTDAATGIRITSGTGHKLYYNSINLYGSLTGTTTSNSVASSPIVITSTAVTGIDIRNNLLNNKSTAPNAPNGEHMAIWFPASYNFSAAGNIFNHNGYYVTGGSSNHYVAKVGVTTGSGLVNTLVDLQAITLQDAQSVPVLANMEAPFTTDNNLTIPAGTVTTLESGGVEILALVIPNIDFTSANRPAGTGTAPDIGAYEFEGVLPSGCTGTPDGGSAISNTNWICPGVNFTLSLVGNTVEFGIEYQWQSSPDDITYIDITGETSSTLNTSQTASTYYRAKVTCTNGGVFDYSDPVFVITPVALNGVYSINSALPTGGNNFQSFTDAATVLNCVGVAGPVTIDVVSGSGPYSEQFLLGAVTGTNSANTILINGNNEIIQFNSTTSARAIIHLDGTDWVTLNDLNIVTLNTTFGYGILLANEANDNSITNCIIDISATTSTTQSNSAGIVASGSATVVTTVGNSANNLLIENNEVIGAYQGIRLNGAVSPGQATGNIVRDNIVREFYADGISIINQNGTLIEGNDISRANRAAVTSFAGVEVGAGNLNVLVNANRVHDTHNSATTQTGLAFGVGIVGADAPVGSENKVTNNLVYNMNSGSGTIYGIYNSSSDGAYYYHNTVVLDNASSTGGITRGFYQVTLATNIQVKNNVMFITRGGTGTKNCLYFGTTTSTITSNNNVLYINASAGTNGIGSLGTTNHPTLFGWQLASGQDGASVDHDPQFVAPAINVYITNNPLVHDIGANLLGIVDFDIEGTARSSTPDPGAIEFAGLPTCSGTPEAGSISTGLTNVCNGTSINFSASGYTVDVDITYQWVQSSSATGPFTAIPGADGFTYSTDPLTADVYFAFVVTCTSSNQSDTSNVIFIDVNNPQILTSSGASTCGLGSVTLQATADPLYTLNWYDVPTGGMPLQSGNSFTTPVISSTTTYYVGASEGGNVVNMPSPTAGTSCFITASTGWGLRFTVNLPVTIGNVDIYPHNSTPGPASAQIIVTDLSDVVLFTGPVYNFNTTSSVCANSGNQITVPVNIALIPGDYKMGIVYTNLTGLVRESSGVSFPYNSIGGELSITAGANGTGTSQTTSSYYWFYNWQLITGCEGERVPVVATVSQPDPITITASQSDLCGVTPGSTTITLTASSVNPGYNYTWTGPDLNSTSGSSVTATPNVAGWYIVTGDDGICTALDSIFISIGNSPNVTASASLSDICDGAQVQLSAEGLSNTFNPCTIQVGSNTTSINSAGPIAVLSATSANVYSRHIAIYTAAEIFAAGGNAGVINQLSWNKISTASYLAADAQFDIYIKPVFFTTHAVTPINWATEIGGATLVYSSTTQSIPAASGWLDFPLTTPFSWNGIDNLEIFVDWHRPSSPSGSITWQYTVTTNGSATTSSSTLVTNVTRSNNRPNIKFSGTCGSPINYSWLPSADLNDPSISNPIATPSASTLFTVVATDADNGCTASATVQVNVDPLPAAPTAQDATRCGLGEITVGATGTGTLRWIKTLTGGEVYNVGSSYTTNIDATTEFYVLDDPGSITTNFGPLDPSSIGTVSSAFFTGNWEVFSVLSHTGIILEEVDIFFTAPIGSPYIIVIEDNTGATLDTIPGTTTTTGGVGETVNIGTYIPQGTGYRLRFALNPGSNRAIGVAAYPYTIPGQISWTGNNFGSDRVYFFYNWKVRTGCFGPMATVTGTVTPPPALIISSLGPTAYCEAGSVTLTATNTSYVSHTWSPATGLNTTNGNVVIASPTETTTYTVYAHDGNPLTGCASTESITITVNTNPVVSVDPVAIDPVCVNATIGLNAIGGATSFKQIGTQQSDNLTSNGIYNGANTSGRAIMLLNALELNNAGLFGPTAISSAAFQVAFKGSSQPYADYTIRMGHTSLTVLTTTYPAATLTEVFQSNVTTVQEWNTHPFTTQFIWDGTSNLLIEVCFTNASPSIFDFVYTTPALFNSYIMTNGGGCAAVMGDLSVNRPNIRLTGGPVNYSWSPVTGLSNPNTANPDFTPTATGPHVFTVTATDPATGCTETASVTVNVSNTPTMPTATITGDNDFCQSGETTIEMTGSTGIIQWESSPDGTTWANISGANSAVYNTGILTDTTYFRVITSCGNSATSNTVVVIVNNPTIVNTIPDTRCGIGTVTLQATGSSGTTLNWYANPVGGTPISIGNTFVTPILTSTTDFYVSASAGGTTGMAGRATPFPTSTGFSGNDYGLVFDVFSEFTLFSIDVYPTSSTGNLTIELVNGSGVVVQSSGPHAIPAGTGTTFGGGATPHTINLNFTIPPGTNYELRSAAQTVSIVRDNPIGTNFTYPLPIASAGNITSGLLAGSANENTYYYFYNWQFSTGCEGPRVPVTATVTPAPEVIISSSVLVSCGGDAVTLTASSSNDPNYIYIWEPGSMSGAVVTVNPLETTTYTVTATDPISLCVNILEFTMNVLPTPAAPVTSDYTFCQNTPILPGEGLTAICGGIGGSVTVLSENFNSGAPSWTRTLGGTSPSNTGWLDQPDGYVPGSSITETFHSNDNSQFVMSNSDAGGLGSNSDAKLISPAFSTMGLTSCELSFYHAYRNWTTGDITVAVEASTDGITWTVLQSYLGNTALHLPNGFVAGAVNLNGFLNQPTVYIRFNYVADWGYYWAIDNILITGTMNLEVNWYDAPTGGNLVYTGSVFDPIGNNIVSSNNPGTYTFYARCAGIACESPATPAVLIIDPMTTPVIISTQSMPLCEGETTVLSTQYSAANGFTFSWNGGLFTTESITVDVAGTYDCVVTSPNGCTSTLVTFDVEISTIFADVFEIIDASCFGGSDGSVEIEALGAITEPQSIIYFGPFDYAVDGGALQSSPLFTGLAAGTYTFEVHDPTTGCVLFIPATVGEPTPLVAGPITVNSNVSCNGGMDGSATASASGGTGSYTFDWLTPIPKTGETNDEIPAGTWTVVVTDENGCTSTTEVTITEPDELVADLGTDMVIPWGTANGYTASGCTNITASVSGGTASYTYLWSTGDTTNPLNICYNKDTIITFTVTVTDVNGCTATATVTYTWANIDCSNNSNGTKVTICHVPPGNPGGCKTICVSISAAAGLFTANPNSYLGPCQSTCPTARVAAPEITETLRVNLFPNPTSGKVIVDYMSDHTPVTTIMVMDIQGRVLQTHPIANRLEFARDIDLGTLENGLYIINIMSDQIIISSSRVVKTQ